MEIASDELITEAEKERTFKVLNEHCLEAWSALSETEAKLTARAIFPDAVAAAAKVVAEIICAESVSLALEVVAGVLKDSSQHPLVEGIVVKAVQPVARNGVFAAVRCWCQERAIPKAESAAKEIILASLGNGCLNAAHTKIIAGARVLLESHISSNPQLSLLEREKLLDNYLAVESEKVGAELVAGGLSAELRRKAQRVAEFAVEEIAVQATDTMVRVEALAAARLVAIETAKMEISKLVLAEAQRRAAKLARERLSEEAAAQDDDKRVEYCQELARKIAWDAVNSVSGEIAEIPVTELDLEKARELALSAAFAVAREFSGGYQLTLDDESTRVSRKTLIFLAVQILTGCFIVWFFLLGGFKSCEPLLKALLPESLYHSFYREAPLTQPTNSNTNAKNEVEVDDLLDELKQPGAAKESPEDGVPLVKPEGRSPDAFSIQTGAKQTVVPERGMNSMEAGAEPVKTEKAEKK